MSSTEPGAAQERWYSAVPLIEVRTPDEPDVDDPLFEKSVVLIQARDEAAARAIARQHCADIKSDYPNMYSRPVEWRCNAVIGVEDVYATEIDSGTEVYSDFLNQAEAGALLATADSSPDTP